MAHRSQEAGPPHKGARDQYHALEEKEALPYTIYDALAQPGLEVVPNSGHDEKQVLHHAGQEDKQVVIQEEKELDQPGKVVYDPPSQSDWVDPKTEELNKSRRICGLKRVVFWALLVAILFAVALATGMGAGLASQKSNHAVTSPPTSQNVTSSTTTASPTAPTASAMPDIGGAIDPSYYSRSGAWNGSGIAYVWQNFSQNWDDILRSNEYSHVVYFQEPSGDIRWMRETSDYSWKEGAQDLVVVATDARNSTPISAVQYTANGTNYWNVFCRSAWSRDGVLQADAQLI